MTDLLRHSERDYSDYGRAQQRFFEEARVWLGNRRNDRQGQEEQPDEQNENEAE